MTGQLWEMTDIDVKLTDSSQGSVEIRRSHMRATGPWKTFRQGKGFGSGGGDW